jgi:hypothetical protein
MHALAGQRGLRDGGPNTDAYADPKTTKGPHLPAQPLKILAPRPGLEPGTYGLTDGERG